MTYWRKILFFLLLKKIFDFWKFSYSFMTSILTQLLIRPYFVTTFFYFLYNNFELHRIYVFNNLR